jgi:hypothetical protein
MPRDKKQAEEYWIQPADGVRLITPDYPPEPEVSEEEIMSMAVEITNGARNLRRVSMRHIGRRGRDSYARSMRFERVVGL